MTSVTYSLAYKRALPNYENVTAFFAITDDVRDGETVDAAKGRLVGKVDAWLEDKIRELDEDAKA